MLRRRTVIGFIAVLVAVLVIKCWPESEEERKARNAFNLENEVVRIDIAGQHFNIPMRYMYGEAIEKYRRWPKAKRERIKVGALTLSVLLPDMRPYYVEENERWTVRGPGDRVEVTIEEQRTSDWNNMDLALEYAKKAGYEISRSVDGALSIKEPANTKYLYSVDDLVVLSRCNTEPTHEFHSCRVKSNYREGIILNYRYDIKHFQEWRAIDKSLKEMFERFLETAQSEHGNMGE